jgi:hypothetical protein
MRERATNCRKPVIGRQTIWRDVASNLAMIFNRRDFLFAVSFLAKSPTAISGLAIFLLCQLR